MREENFWKKTEDYVGYLLMRFFCILVYLIPAKITYKIADILGILTFYISKKYRNIVIGNLKYVFEDKYNDKEVKRIAKDVFRNQAKNLFEFFLFAKMSKEDLKNKMKAENIHYLDDALSHKKGIILISGHLGNWEMGLLRIAADNYPVQCVYRPANNSRVNKFIEDTRLAKGVKLISRSSSNKELYYNCLKNNEILVLAIDQNAREAGILIDFLGKPAYAFCGWVVLHQNVGSPIVVVACRREKNSSHTIVFEKPIYLEFTGDKDNDLRYNTQKINKIIEKYILQDPSQWFWLHKRWEIS